MLKYFYKEKGASALIKTDVLVRIGYTEEDIKFSLCERLPIEKSEIKEIRLAQFETNPHIVRAVITFEEDFDTTKIKLKTTE